MKWISAIDLDRWADTVGSRPALPELVSSLVRASVVDAGSFYFPTGDSAQAQGYDGTLEARGVPPYVPDGKSVWEFGTSKDYLKKADDDYTTRSEKPRSVVPKETTFVFVTPRHWKRIDPSLEEWKKKRLDEGVWKDVRVIDGVGLESWLEECPAVGARAAREILSIMPANGAQSTDEFWDEYSALLNHL